MTQVAINIHAYRHMVDHMLHLLLNERPTSLFVDVTRLPLLQQGEQVGEQVSELSLSFFPEHSQVSVTAARFVTAVSGEGRPT